MFWMGQLFGKKCFEFKNTLTSHNSEMGGALEVLDEDDKEARRRKMGRDRQREKMNIKT